ncbi:MAG TPA: hypothetical protein ENI05_11260 [Porticoccus sp.]|nr:hypothetical protein [Porticoccus sp.]
MNWTKVMVLFLYIGGALISLAIAQGDSSGEAIAYMFAGAAANQGASLKNGQTSRSKRNTDSPIH